MSDEQGIAEEVLRDQRDTFEELWLTEEKRAEDFEQALRDIRRLCADGHGDDLIAETADRALAVSPADTTEAG